MNVVPRDLMTEIPVSPADFRGAMRHLTGGVSVITAGRGKDITGMTVTSVTSLSVEPPTLLVSINRDASSFPLIRRHGAFGVNILNADQLDVAERFSGKDGLKCRSLCRQPVGHGRLGRSAPGRRAVGVRLRGRGDRRAALARHRHRPCQGRQEFDADCGARLLARPVRGGRPGRRRRKARRGQPSLAQPARHLIAAGRRRGRLAFSHSSL